FEAKHPMTLNDEAEAVLTFIADYQGTAHLVGHSYGGAIAMILAMAHPDRFSTLTLIEPAAYWLLAQVGDDALAREVETANLRFMSLVDAGHHDAAFQGYFAFYNGAKESWSGLSPSIKQRVLSVAKQVAAGLGAVRAFKSPIIDLTKLRVPSLVVRGSQTDAVHARLTEIVADAIPKAALKMIEGAGHMSPLTHPSDLSDIIRSHALATSIAGENCRALR
ncbi:MAG: alpha/beta fold hydrolase, partial [Geminicoccaceae bacterium]